MRICTFWNHTVLEHQFTRIASPHTELVQFLVGRESLEAFLDYERGDTLGALLRRGFRVNDEGRSHSSIRDPELIPVQLPTTVNLLRFQLHANDIASAPWFAHGQTPNLLPGNEIRKVLGLLLGCSPTMYLVDTQVRMGTVRKGDRARRSGEFFHGKGMLEIALIETTILRGNSNSQETHLAKFPPKVLNVQWNVSGLVVG